MSDAASRPVAVTIRADAGPLVAALSALAELADRLPEVRDGLLGPADFAKELVTLKPDALSAGAGEIVVRLEPSDRLLGLLSAGGAGNA